MMLPFWALGVTGLLVFFAPWRQFCRWLISAPIILIVFLLVINAVPKSQSLVPFMSKEPTAIFLFCIYIAVVLGMLVMSAIRRKRNTIVDYDPMIESKVRSRLKILRYIILSIPIITVLGAILIDPFILIHGPVFIGIPTTIFGVGMSINSFFKLKRENLREAMWTLVSTTVLGVVVIVWLFILASSLKGIF
ncbi:MAG TPA: hypothetical protein VJJ22_04655 [Candidatus Paceibacterota bacterium]